MAKKIGRGETPLSPPTYAIDSIDISSSIQGGFSEKIAEMYADGHSLRDISATLEIGKTTALESLQKQGFATDSKTLRKRGQHIGAAPYGYSLVQGKLLPVPKEQKIVRIIMSKWKLGKSFRAIASELNAKGIPPRTGKSWDHSTISSIVNRHKKNQNQ